MKMITGFLTPDAGTVTVGGDSLADHPQAVKRRIGYLPEGAPLYGDMTTLAFLDFVAQVRGLRGRDRQQCLERVVSQVNLQNVMHQPIETLSKGFKRRVGLAQAILHDPEVLILDEPTDGLDPNQKFEVRRLIREMAAEKAIILSTHILEEVDAVCSRAVIIAEGGIVADGTPEELEARSPRHRSVTLSLSGEGLEAAAEALGGLPGVASAETLESGPRFRARLYPDGEPPSPEAIGELARRRGWQLVELHVERGRLDDVFRAVTGASEEAA
jgi:ABC-2 type transport system ATP-binding protein